MAPFARTLIVQLRCLLILLALAVSLPSASAVAPAVEYQSKAARIARIAQVTLWPVSKLGASKALVIGVFGDELMTTYLQEAVQGRRLNGREVIVKRCSAVQEIASCHVVFIGQTEQERQREILRKAASEPILTVGDSESFMDRGGIVRLAMNGGTAQFTFDASNLKRSRLEIDPEALALANPPPRR